MAGERVTHPAAVATLPVMRALLDQAGRKDYRSGVLGVRARPEWPAAAEFTHGSTLVRVVPCVSALAVREAITARDKSGWLVVLTDRADDDLGAGIRAIWLATGCARLTRGTRCGSGSPPPASTRR